MDCPRDDEPSQWIAKLSKKEAKELLQKWRESNSRNSEMVREIWLTHDLSGSLGDEKWIVLEQVTLAAMDLHDKNLLKDTISQLHAQFPNSARVRRLKLMANLELTERYDEALHEYSSMLASDETNGAIHKRKIAILLAARRNQDAIKTFCEYLKNFMNDHEAWLQLANLYIQEQEYAKAAFCVEELILTSPQNHLYHEKYAEIQYTIGTSDALELARSYFAQAVRLKPDSLRALFGLILSANALAALPRTSVQKKKEYGKLASWASVLVGEVYRKNLPLGGGGTEGGDEEGKVDRTQVEAVEGMLASLAIN